MHPIFEAIQLYLPKESRSKQSLDATRTLSLPPFILEAIIETPIDGQWPDEAFNHFALDLYKRQFDKIEVVKQLFELEGEEGTEIDNLTDYRQIPGLVTDLFKFRRIFAHEDAKTTFHTSGTTTGEHGEHHFKTLDYYRAAMIPMFKHFVMGSDSEIEMLMFVVDPKEAPNSSLSFMMGEVSKIFGDDHSKFYCHKKDDDITVDYEVAAARLKEVVEQKKPVLIMGTAFSLLDFLEHDDSVWNLAPGSRILETGGLKGREKSYTKPEIYEKLIERFQVAESHVISEYSMTELSSQAYTDNFVKNIPWHQGAFVTPPWVRVELIKSSENSIINDPNESGIIRWYDLANVDSSISVETADLGQKDAAQRLTLHGRAPESELRGCSLTYESLE